MDMDEKYIPTDNVTHQWNVVFFTPDAFTINGAIAGQRYFFTD